jgi:hypothetical protein
VDHCSFAYSPLACFRMGMSGSAVGERVKSRELQIKRVNLLRAYVT